MRLNTPEGHARAYCESIGADPDATVKGYADGGNGTTIWYEMPRWRWYVGSFSEALRRPITGA